MRLVSPQDSKAHPHPHQVGPEGMALYPQEGCKMELIQLPRPMRNKGFSGWPEIYRIGRKEEPPPVGVSYIIAEKVDFPLVFRLMVPILMKQHGYFDWPAIYQSLTGHRYKIIRVYQQRDNGPENTGHEYYESDLSRCDVTLEELSRDDATYVDLDMLTELAMLPAFMSDIRSAITVNVTNNFMWQDGFNKKTGICTGSLIEQPKATSLVILDISSSIPDGVSAGMLTLIKTITDIVCADLIITAGRSEFYTLAQVRDLDIHQVRHSFSRGNESKMFREILATHDMDYRNVITFGDSDTPGPIMLEQKITTECWYSFFCMRHDTYGNHFEHGAGYGRWVKENNPYVKVVSNTDWAKYFSQGRWC